jgi:hypothetical protein
MAAAAIAGPERTRLPLEPDPPLASGLKAIASAAPAPDPGSSPVAETLAPATAGAPVRLPYPFHLMTPAKVPEAVWIRARAEQRGT